MALLKAGRIEVEICFDKYRPKEWIDYSIVARICGNPLFNPALFKYWRQKEKYICSDCYGKDDLIPFLVKFLKERTEGEWRHMLDIKTSMRLESWGTKKRKTKKDREDKFVWITDLDGELKQVPYEEGVGDLLSLADDYFDMHLSLDLGFFAGVCDNHITLDLVFTFDDLELFVAELKAEQELARLSLSGGKGN